MLILTACHENLGYLAVQPDPELEIQTFVELNSLAADKIAPATQQPQLLFSMDHNTMDI
jgi:hypothetical protein